MNKSKDFIIYRAKKIAFQELSMKSINLDSE